MTATLARPLLTTEELLQLPQNGVERWLIRGLLREKPMTVRNRIHSRIMARIVYLLEKWLEMQAEPRGQVLCGEAGCRLSRDPDTTVGIDVVYVAANLVQQDTDATTLIDGVPVLAVEINSPNDTAKEINEKINSYLAAGVSLVWIVDPYRQTIMVFRQDHEPELVTISQELVGDPFLPGFKTAAREVFA